MSARALNRHLGRGAARGVSALRLAAVAGDLVALGGAHALVLLDADEAPASADWLTCEAWASAPSQDEIARRLLEQGASCSDRSDERGPFEQWTHIDGKPPDRAVLRRWLPARGDHQRRAASR